MHFFYHNNKYINVDKWRTKLYLFLTKNWNVQMLTNSHIHKSMWTALSIKCAFFLRLLVWAKPLGSKEGLSFIKYFSHWCIFFYLCATLGQLPVLTWQCLCAQSKGQKESARKQDLDPVQRTWQWGRPLSPNKSRKSTRAGVQSIQCAILLLLAIRWHSTHSPVA